MFENILLVIVVCIYGLDYIRRWISQQRILIQNKGLIRWVTKGVGLLPDRPKTPDVDWHGICTTRLT